MLITIEEPVKLECGVDFGPVTVAYETYGTLNDDKSNAILILHALTGDANAAGWWHLLVGPGKVFDADKYFIICSNVLGGCKGTTGPSSINPATGKPYGLDFPVITIEDMVKVQKKLIEYLGIERLLSVAGGSMGGMQAMQWGITYPESVKSVIAIASTARLSAQGIAFNAVGRNAIMSDPEKGLSIARMLAHVTYLCEESMHNKFGRKLQDKAKPDFSLEDIDFQVESYLQHQGRTFVDRFDAHSYLYITKATDYFDIVSKYSSIEQAFERTDAKFLVISFTSDWLFPTWQSKEIVNALMKSGKEVSFCEIESPHGHDAFLLKSEAQERILAGFLEGLC
jgi:homoserine O-acetyltransferase